MAHMSALMAAMSEGTAISVKKMTTNSTPMFIKVATNPT